MSLFSGVATNALSQASSLVVVRPRRKIGTFVADVVLQEEHIDDLEVTQHPVQQGASISDHAFKRPAKCVIRCAWSDSPPVSGLVGGVVAGTVGAAQNARAAVSGTSVNTPGAVYEKLLALQAAREPFDVWTGKRRYANMLLQSISVRTDPATENILDVTATLQEVIIVSTSVVSLATSGSAPADAAVTSGSADKGTVQLKQVQ